MTDPIVSAPPKHTPGPSVGEWEYDDGTGQVDVADGTICVGITWRPNGHLIAAAPDLLAALKEIQEKAFDYAHGKPAYPTPVVNARWLLKVTNEAIAKAEGR